MFIDSSVINPDKIALLSDKTEITYDQLKNQIINCGEMLRLQGIKQGDAVLILIPNSPSFVITTLAVLSLGAIAVPSNTNFSEEEIQYYCDSSVASAIIYISELNDIIKNLSGNFVSIPAIESKQLESLAKDQESDLCTEIKPDNAALYMFSSGSTGKPKRITRTHEDIIAEYNALSETIELTEHDIIICTVPLYHAHGFGNCMIASILSGASLILVEGSFNPRETLRCIERNKVTIYPAVPFMFKLIAETRFKNQPVLDSLRLLFSAGAALTEDVFLRFQEIFGKNIWQLYGSTETGAVSINYKGIEGTEASVGLPLQGISIDIVDDSGQSVAANEPGQIAIKSPAMTTCYDSLPELTTECFVNGSFLSGDLGFKDDNGRIYIKGRKKLLINVAGNKVDPLDVESIIIKHPAVKEVVVVGKDHAQYGEIVKAAIVCTEECSSEEIISFCQQRLTDYKVPKIIEFRDSIPKSPLGKIQRKYL